MANVAEAISMIRRDKTPRWYACTRASALALGRLTRVRPAAQPRALHRNREIKGLKIQWDFNQTPDLQLLERSSSMPSAQSTSGRDFANVGITKSYCKFIRERLRAKLFTLCTFLNFSTVEYNLVNNFINIFYRLISRIWSVWLLRGSCISRKNKSVGLSVFKIEK